MMMSVGSGNVTWPTSLVSIGEREPVAGEGGVDDIDDIAGADGTGKTRTSRC